MGDCYASALSKSLKYTNPEIINLSDNRLSKIGSYKVLKNLKSSISYLNISQNTLGSSCANKLGLFLKAKANLLRVLNLENTKLGDIGAISLCKQLIDHPRLTELNLAKNHITDLSADAISQVVYDTFYLMSLILHWNSITGEGGSKILKSTLRYNNMKILDLSWNIIGTYKSNAFANQLSELLIEQEYFLHLDLSHNLIKAEDCKIISDGLSGNHSLWGFHFIGNENYSIDSKGYLNEGVSNNQISSEHLETRINGANMTVTNSDLGDCSLKRVHNCWLCEGWNEALIEFPQEKPTEPVYLNMEWDNYKGDLMYTEESSSGYVLWRMWPPGRTRFFFTTEGKAKISYEYPIMKCNLYMRVIRVIIVD